MILESWKKLHRLNTTTMKVFCLVTFVLLSCSSLAQDNKKLFPFKPFEHELNKTMISKYLQEQQQPLYAAGAAGSKLLNKNILILPLDNMPCKLLDASNFNMPVLKLQTTGWIPMVR